MQAVGEDFRELERNLNEEEQHLAILDDFVGKVLLDVDVLRLLPPADYVVTPLDARCILLVHWGERCLGPPYLLEELAEIQDLSSSSRACIVLSHCQRQSSSFLNLLPPHDWSLQGN